MSPSVKNNYSIVSYSSGVTINANEGCGGIDTSYCGGTDAANCGGVGASYHSLMGSRGYSYLGSNITPLPLPGSRPLRAISAKERNNLNPRN